MPPEIVKQMLSLCGNGEIVKLLMDYREEAIRLSNCCQQAADDILWYGKANFLKPFYPAGKIASRKRQKTGKRMLFMRKKSVYRFSLIQTAVIVKSRHMGKMDKKLLTVQLLRTLFLVRRGMMLWEIHRLENYCLHYLRRLCWHCSFNPFITS